MQRALAGLVIAGMLGGAVAVLGATDSPAPSSTSSAHASRVLHDDAHDISRPLRDLVAPSGGDADHADTDRPDGDHGDGDAPHRGGDPKENAHRPYYVTSAPHRADGALQTAASTRVSAQSMPAPTVSFDGIDQAHSTCGGCVPPDTNAEAGPNDVVEMTNTAIAVYDKAGNIRPGFPKAIKAIWAGFSGAACANNNDGDPVVVYDQLAGRWLISQFAIPGMYGNGTINYQCVALSTSSDPTGSWARYQFAFPSGVFADYPKVGVWPDGYYFTFNDFQTVSPYGFLGTSVVAFDRDAMLGNAPRSVTAQEFDINGSGNCAGVSLCEYGMLPGDLDGNTQPTAGAPEPIVAMYDGPAMGFPQDEVLIRRLHVDWTTPASSTLSSGTPLPTAPFDSNMCGYNLSCVGQSGTTAKVDALSDRIMFRAPVRVDGNGHDSMLINATVDATGTDRAGIRWVQLDDTTTSSPSIAQQGTYSPDSTNRWMGSIAADSFGNIALGYSASSTAMHPALRYTGRLAGDPANGLMTQGEATLFAGAGSQTSTGLAARWGDYSDLSVDPTDDCTFWYANEYYAANSTNAWRTRIGSFYFPGCVHSSLPSLSVADVAITEGNSGTKTLNFTVKLSKPAPSNVTFNAATTNGTGIAGSDYLAVNVNKTILAGQSSVVVPVTIKGDTTIEPNETLFLNITHLQNASLARGTARAVILNDDGPTLAMSNASVTEGNSGTKTMTFTVHLSLVAAGTVSVKFQTTSGTATAGSDFVATSGTLSFPHGTVNKTIAVTIKGDTVPEPNETFGVWLSSPVGATILFSPGTGTIVNDD